MNVLKWVGIGAGALLALFAIVIVLAVLLIDANDYKDDI